MALLFGGLDREIVQLVERAQQLSSRDFGVRLPAAPAGALRELSQVLATLEGQIARYERRLQDDEALFGLSSDLLCIAGTDGFLRRVNPAFSRTLGFPPRELLARPFFDFVHADDVATTREEVLKLSRGIPSVNFVNRYRCRDGSYRVLNWHCQPSTDGTLYAIARDITEHQRLARELHERELEARTANQAKSAFLAAMSHEIRTPLIGVLGMLEVLGRSRLNPEQRRQFEIVQQSASSLLEIVGDILDYSKIEAGKVDITPATLAVRDVVSRVISTFSANAHAKGLRLVQDVGAEVAAAHIGDAVRIRQVLANFVGNAVKFTDHGVVTLSVCVLEEGAGSQRLDFCVTDTGIGIPREQLPRLFQPFAQYDASSTRRFGGTGLGLVISRRLAGLMGGTVHADSEPGVGTTMHLDLVLPVGDPAALAASTSRQDEPVRTRRKPSREQAEREGSLLLLAEDHPINRKVLTDQLDLAGFCVDTAETGTVALDKFRAGAYGLVLTDLHMPGLDGFQLTAAIREFESSHGRRRTPIVALTANVLRADVERTLACGMDDYLAKPVTVRQLTEKLRRLLPGLDWSPPMAAERRSPHRGMVIDESVLRESMAGDTLKVRDLLQLYCRSSAEDLDRLEISLRSGPGEASAMAHRIKGAALMVGAREVAGLALRLERAAGRSPTPDLAPYLDKLRQALARVRDHVSVLT